MAGGRGVAYSYRMSYRMSYQFLHGACLPVCHNAVICLWCLSDTM